MTASPATLHRATLSLPPTARLGLRRGALELRAFLREKDALVFTFAFPLLLLALFGSVFRGEVAPGVSFSQYFVAGLVGMSVLLTGFQNLAIAIAVERDDGTLKRLAGTPLPPAAYFLGKIVLVVAVSAVQIALLLALGTAFFGLQLPADPMRWVTFAWVVLLGATVCTLLGIGFSSVPRSGRSASAVVSPIVIVLPFLSGVYFVYAELPAWMQGLAALLPLKWLTQGMRSVFLPDSFAFQEPAGGWEHGRVALVLCAWAAIGLVLCLRTFRWRRRDAG